jgi:hypothetical protein
MKSVQHLVRRSAAALCVLSVVGVLACVSGCSENRSQPTGSAAPGGMMKDGMAKDGMMTDGMMKDNAMKDGMMKEGAMKEGMMKDGAMKEGMMKEGAAPAGGDMPAGKKM